MGFILMIVFSLIIGIVATAIIENRQARRKEAAEINAVKPVDSFSSRVRWHTKLCFETGTTFSRRNEPVIGQGRRTAWEEIQEELCALLKNADEVCHAELKKEMALEYSSTYVKKNADACLLFSQQRRMCMACLERQKQSSQFYCLLSAPRNAGRMDERGNIRISQVGH